MAALKDGEITDEQFLGRLTFHESKVCDYLAEFPDEICDELIFEDGGDDDDSLDECQSMQNNDEQDIGLPLCPTCNDRKRECILMPCRHLYFCSPCYDKWSITNPDTFDFMDEDFNIPPIHNGGPISVKCPVCKQPVSSVIKALLA